MKRNHLNVNERINVRSAYPELSSRQISKDERFVILISERLRKPDTEKYGLVFKYKDQPFRNICNQNNFKKKVIYAFSF